MSPEVGPFPSCLKFNPTSEPLRSFCCMVGKSEEARLGWPCLQPLMAGGSASAEWRRTDDRKEQELPEEERR